MFVSYFPSFNTCTLLKSNIWWQKVYRPDITALVAWVCKTPVYLLTCLFSGVGKEKWHQGSRNDPQCIFHQPVVAADLCGNFSSRCCHQFPRQPFSQLLPLFPMATFHPFIATDFHSNLLSSCCRWSPWQLFSQSPGLQLSASANILSPDSPDSVCTSKCAMCRQSGLDKNVLELFLSNHVNVWNRETNILVSCLRFLIIFSVTVVRIRCSIGCLLLFFGFGLGAKRVSLGVAPRYQHLFGLLQGQNHFICLPWKGSEDTWLGLGRFWGSNPNLSSPYPSNGHLHALRAKPLLGVRVVDVTLVYSLLDGWNTKVWCATGEKELASKCQS